MKIKAVVFDGGGVLWTRIHFKRHYELMRGTRFSGIIDPPWWNAFHKKATKGYFKEKEYLEIISRKIGKDSNTIRSIYLKWLRKAKIRKSILNLVIKLKKKGYKTAVLSNVNPFDYNYHYREKHYKHFDHEIVSARVGYRKPNKSIYKFTLEKLKVRPSEMIFIDDLERNLRPARKMGIQTILFKDSNNLKKELKKLGVKF